MTVQCRWSVDIGTQVIWFGNMIIGKYDQKLLFIFKLFKEYN